MKPAKKTTLSVIKKELQMRNDNLLTAFKEQVQLLNALTQHGDGVKNIHMFDVLQSLVWSYLSIMEVKATLSLVKFGRY